MSNAIDDRRQILAAVVSDMRGTRTLRDFAKDLGVSYGTLRAWERGESFPDAVNLELLAKARGQSLHNLMTELNGGQPEQQPVKAEDLYYLAARLSFDQQIQLLSMLVQTIAENVAKRNPHEVV